MSVLVTILALLWQVAMGDYFTSKDDCTNQALHKLLELQRTQIFQHVNQKQFWPATHFQNPSVGET